MNKTQTIIIVVLAGLVVALSVALGYTLLSSLGNVGKAVGVSVLRRPHHSAKAVTRAWIEAVDEGDCDESKSYLSPGSTAFMCGGEGTERLLSADISRIDVDPGGPVEYSVKVYGRFMLLLKPRSGAPEDMDRLHRVESEIIRLYVEEIDGEYYISPFSDLLFGMLKPAH